MTSSLESVQSHDESLESLDLTLSGDTMEGADLSDPHDPLLVALRESNSLFRLSISMADAPNMSLALKAMRCVPNLKILHLSASFDNSGKHGMCLEELASALERCPKLSILELTGIGFLGDENDDLQQQRFDSLSRVFERHNNLKTISIENVFFLQTTSPNSWKQPGQLLRALLTSRIQRLTISAVSRHYGRPVLTLEIASELLGHKTLEYICLQKFAFWGSNGDCVHQALAENSRLRQLHLRECSFASEDSILAGLAQNRSIQQLELGDSALGVGEGTALAKALHSNECLCVLGMSRVSFSTDLDEQRKVVFSIIRAIRFNNSLRTLRMRQLGGFGCHSSGDHDAIEQYLKALRTVLKTNRSLEQWTMGSLPGVLCYIADDISLSLGLNMTRFWNLTQDASPTLDWIQSLGRAPDASCTFTVLKENPLVIAK